MIKSTPICPICGKTHGQDPVCIRDNLKGVSNQEYSDERQKSYHALGKEISEFRKLESDIVKIKDDIRRREDSLSILKRERNVQSNRNINLEQLNEELLTLSDQLKLLEQELAQLKTNTRDLSDYEQVDFLLKILNDIINLH